MFTAAIKLAACGLRSGCVCSPWVTDGMTAHWRIETHSSPHMYTHCTHRVWVLIHPLSNIRKNKYHLSFWIFENNHTTCFKRIFATYVHSVQVYNLVRRQYGQFAPHFAVWTGVKLSASPWSGVLSAQGYKGCWNNFELLLNIMNSNYQSS